MQNRTDAAAAGLKVFNTGKPCRRGHNSDRYVSNGSCIACLMEDQEARRQEVQVGRRKFINAMVNNFHERTFLVRDEHRPLVQKFCEALQYGGDHVYVQLQSIVETFHDQVPSPKALNKLDLVRITKYGTPEFNFAHLELYNVVECDRETGVMYLNHNGHKYLLSKVEEVLTNKRLIVTPI